MLLFYFLAACFYATKCIKARRHGQEVQLFFRPNVRMGMTFNLSDFDCGMIVGARQGGLSMSETADLLRFPHTTVSRVCREWCEKLKSSSEQQFCRQKSLVNERGQRRRARLVDADRKVTETQITRHYNSGMQKSTPEHTMCQTSK